MGKLSLEALATRQQGDGLYVEFVIPKDLLELLQFAADEYHDGKVSTLIRTIIEESPDSFDEP